VKQFADKWSRRLQIFWRFIGQKCPLPRDDRSSPGVRRTKTQFNPEVVLLARSFLVYLTVHDAFKFSGGGQEIH
jgi:hypothetical protein